ncbi:thiamine phosphate synthase [Maricaulis sp. D1M11]|uniref:thiamine phosphate synthase n=1 Tax=Maricaulis sp. D1M11 TaxID=3076117 RepID=UPI0039B51FFD
MSDPGRIPDVLEHAQRLPRGGIYVLRHFGREDILSDLPELERIVHERQGLFLASWMSGLVSCKHLDGFHFPERHQACAARLRARGDKRFFTVSAHSPGAVRKTLSLHPGAVIVSTAFSSQSPTATRPLGPWRLACLQSKFKVPVYALGGITPVTLKRLNGLGLSGAAGVSSF